MEFSTERKDIIRAATVAAAGIGGGYVGSALGRPSGALGLVVTVVGVLANEPHITVGGAAMMVSGSQHTMETEIEIQARQASGAKMEMKQEVEYGKDRANQFLASMKKKLYIDKLGKKEDTQKAIEPVIPEGMEGLGNTRHNESAISDIVADVEAAMGNLQMGISNPAMGNLDMAFHGAMGNLDLALNGAGYDPETGLYYDDATGEFYQFDPGMGNLDTAFSEHGIGNLDILI